MRRSSSMSSASACGISPSCAPSTTTYGHSMPLTRCTVDTATPSSRGGLVRARGARAQPRFERGRIGFEGRDRDQRVEVVAVARVGRLARQVERRERGAEADLVADAGEELGRWSRRRRTRGRARRGRRRTSRTCRRPTRSGRRSRGAAAACAIAACVRAVAAPRAAATGSGAAPRARGRSPCKPVLLPAASASRRYASAVRVPVRFSTATLTGVQHGTPASPSRSCAGSSDGVHAAEHRDVGGLRRRRRATR